MKCCASCFGDHGLKHDIIPLLCDQVGTCSYCLSSDEFLVDPPRLAEYFEPLINIYEQSAEGRLLVEWLKEDWMMFDHPVMDNPRAKNLLADVLDNGEIVRKLFAPSARFQSDTLDRWELLRDELMYKNRYFPEAHIGADRFGELLAFLFATEVPTKWYRARIQPEDDPFPIEKMGAPPKRIASHGRANPPGIPYLYLASTVTTAIAEIRPHTGETACVADFSVPNELKLVDLRYPRKRVSPFLLGDETEIGKLRSDIMFLERLGEELTRPVLPQGAAIDYVPSQYLCEFIKRCNFDGVIYRSAVSDGINLALFKPELAKPISVSQYVVGRMTVEIRKT